MGNAVWVAFAAAMVAALLTGLSYASIASRYPKAAGAAYVTQRAFGIVLLSYIVGLAVTCSGLTSMAAASNAFADSLRAFAPNVPPWTIKLAFLIVLASINFWGLKESLWLNLLCTTIEIGGLAFIVIVGARFWGDVNYLETPPTTSGLTVPLVLYGTVLTFFAFIGFEDMLNVGEEVKDPQRTMPRGMIAALCVVTVVYILTAITAVSVVDYQRLADVSHGAPLKQITDRAAPWLSPWVFTAITMFAVANTSLINYIMGSRLLYGMSRQGLVPAPLGKVHPKRHTPHVAIGVLFVIVLILALSGGVKQLASSTSLLLLSVFCLVNAALIVLKLRPGEAKGGFEVPIVVPALGSLVCASLVGKRLYDGWVSFQQRDTKPTDDWKAPVIALALLSVILLLYLVMRPRGIPDDEPPTDPLAAEGTH
jgi:amino acid transporter